MVIRGGGMCTGDLFSTASSTSFGEVVMRAPGDK